MNRARQAGQRRHGHRLAGHRRVPRTGRRGQGGDRATGNPTHTAGGAGERAGPLPEARVADIATQLLAALQYTHGKGVVHRDVKPANVLLDGDRVVLTDFGIAVIEGGTALTATNQLIGSPQYLAPERINGQPAGPPSDLWALGVTRRRQLAVALTVVVVLATAAVVWTVWPQGSAADESAMARMAERGSVVIGIREDQPGLGYRKDGSLAGFDIEIATMIADGLGFGADRITFTPVSEAERENARATGAVDMVVGAYPITEAGKQRVSFAGPVPVQRAEPAAPQLRDEINGILNGALDDGTRRDIYDRTLGRSGAEPGIPTVKPY